MHFSKILRHTTLLKLINTALVFLINLLMVGLHGVVAIGIFFYDIAALSIFVLPMNPSLELGIIYIAIGIPILFLRWYLSCLRWVYTIKFQCRAADFFRVRRHEMAILLHQLKKNIIPSTS
jgi:hypothetical protein